MTEIEYIEKINPSLQKKQFLQLDLLFKIYNLRNTRKKLRRKLKILEKSMRRDNNVNFAIKIEAFKVISTENNIKFKDAMSKLENSYNIFKFAKELENYNQYLTNLNKKRNKRLLDLNSYEITKGYYLQKIIDINDNVKHLKDLAIPYFQELKDELIMLEDQRIKLITEKLKKTIDKDKFAQESKEIETLKLQKEEKLAFLMVEVIDFKLS